MPAASETGGGCARKIGPLELEQALAGLASDLTRIPVGPLLDRVDLGDACVLTAKENTRRFATSADLVYLVSTDWYTSGYVAAVHAMSDIFAVLAIPVWATVTVGVPRRDLAEGALTALVGGAAAALSDNGAALAGGHSAYSHEAFVGVAVTGFSDVPQGRAPPTAGDMIVLTKPLGTGIALTGLRLGLATDADLAPEFSVLRESNRHAAQLLRELRMGNPDDVKAVTDVSGFGLLHALHLVMGHASAVIDGSAVQRTPSFNRLLGSGAISPLTDQNMLATDRYTAYEDLGESAAAEFRVLLNDPQTSGGLLAVISQSAVERFAASGSPAVVIGRITNSETSAGVAQIVMEDRASQRPGS